MADSQEHDDDALLLDNEIDEQHEEPAETDDVTIEIEGDDEPEETPLVKRLRQETVDAKREAAALRRQQQPQTPPDPGKKPDLWDDCEGDSDKFERELLAWQSKRQAIADHERRQQEASEQRNHQFERTVANYRSRAAQLGVKDFGEVEAQVTAKVPELLRNAVLQYAEDPAKVMYALGKHPAKLDQLLAVGDPDAGGDPIKFILGIRDVERNMKVVNRRKPPEPEADSIQRGTAPLSRTDPKKELDRLEKEWEKKGGSRNAIIALKKQLKEKK